MAGRAYQLDNVGHLAHLNAQDTSFAAVSRYDKAQSPCH